VTEDKSQRLWIIRFFSPTTGKTVEKSTRTTSKKEAERQAGVLRAELAQHRYETPSRISWEAFRRRFEEERLPALAEKIRLKVATILDAVEDFVRPAKLRDVNEDTISQFLAALRKKKLSEHTILGYCAHLRSALQWAEDKKLIPCVPKIDKPPRAKAARVMRGRPISAQEFDRMLDKVKDVVGEEAEASWRNYLEGMWWSGLRLSESLDLFWNDDGEFSVVFVSDEPMLRVAAAVEKGNTDRLLPIAPEFAGFLLRTPEDQRSGRVFKLKPRKVRGERLTADRVTRIVCEIGRKADVIVDKTQKKFASAHDLRRSFGERWAALVMPQVLMELMRHACIETTLKYYVGRNAARTTRILREAYDKANSDRQGNRGT